MAHVYRARDERLDRAVAVKVLAAPFADDPAYVERFLEEARIAAGVSHPNLAHVYDSGSDEGLHFIVLELLEDHRSLREVLAEVGRLPVADAVRVVRDVLAGLGALHGSGLVHCDVKPGNVLVGDGPAKLIDFGIARPLNQQATGPTSIGSLHSMSPEQLRGDALTPASDVFAAGVVLYGALTGRVPFRGDTPAAVAAGQNAGRPQPPSAFAPDIPELLDAAVLEALEHDPLRRFGSTRAMDVALAAAMAHAELGEAAGLDDTTTLVPIARPPAGPPTPSARAAAISRSGRLPTVAGVLVLVAAIVAGAGILLGGRNSATPTVAADDPSPTPVATPAEADNGLVEIPDTIGMSEAQAEATAREAGLNWRIEWQVDPAQEPGIYDQQPAPGRRVQQGSRFTMYAYRNR
jgi:serine/threonine-protein kinase